MNRTHRITEMGRESDQGTDFCKSNGSIPLYRIDSVTEKLRHAGYTNTSYDFIIDDEEKEYEFPDGETTLGYSVIYRWSTNPFTCIVKDKDIVRHA